MTASVKRTKNLGTPTSTPKNSPPELHRRTVQVTLSIMRKHVLILASVLATLAALPPSAQAVEPLASRCMGIAPICAPATHPICICQSDYSFNCRWECASQ